MSITIPPDVKSYYEQNLRIPRAKFERLRRTETMDGGVAIIRYFLTDMPETVPTKSLAERFCCCTCCDVDPEDSPKKMLEKDLEKQNPIHKWREAVRKMIKLLDLGKKGSLTLRENYWCELIHPNRFARPISYRLFIEWKQNHSQKISFENWLGTESGQKKTQFTLGFYGPEILPMKLLSRKEKEECLAHLDVRDSRYPAFLRPNGLSFTGSLIYVITPDKKIYVGTKKSNSFHHSSFVNGGCVLSAGCIKADLFGNIQEIDSYSGHYTPKALDFSAALEIFREQGMIINENDISKSEEEIDVIYTWENPYRIPTRREEEARDPPPEPR